jgi:hypothetical protein
MARDLALIEDDVPGGIDAGSDEGGRDLARVVLEFVGVLKHGDGVEIDDAVEALMIGLERHELGDGAEIVAEMKIAGGLDARKHPGLGRCHASPLMKSSRLMAWRQPMRKLRRAERPSCGSARRWRQCAGPWRNGAARPCGPRPRSRPWWRSPAGRRRR